MPSPGLQADDKSDAARKALQDMFKGTKDILAANEGPPDGGNKGGDKGGSGGGGGGRDGSHFPS